MIELSQKALAEIRARHGVTLPSIADEAASFQTAFLVAHNDRASLLSHISALEAQRDGVIDAAKLVVASLNSARPSIDAAIISCEAFENLKRALANTEVKT